MGSPATLHIQVVKGSRDLLFEFWDPLYISGTVGACALTTRVLTKEMQNQVKEGRKGVT